MTAVKRHHISILVKEYSRNSGTEDLIGFVADTTGMLSACQGLLQSIDAKTGESLEWLQSECAGYGVARSSFLEEISRIVALFHPDQDVEDHYVTLGVPVGAGSDEIKKAFRRLSLQYHPDTAPIVDRGHPDKFIEITKAYHSLLAVGQNVQKNNSSNPDAQANNWRRKKERSVSTEQRKKVFAWALGLLFVLVLISIIAAVNYRKRAMIAGLQESKSVLVTPSQEPQIITKEKNLVEVTAIDPPIALESLTKTSEEVMNLAQEATQPKDIITLPEKDSSEPDTSDIEPLEGADVVSIAVAEEEEMALTVPSKKEQNSNEGNTEGTSESEETDANVVVAEAATDVNLGVNVAAVETKIPDVPLPESRTLEASSSNASKTVDGTLQETDLRSQIDTFLADYSKAYEQRSIILFSRLFEADAMENGKLFSTKMPTYIDLFAATSELILDVDVISWQKRGSGVDVRGRFKVYLQYKDSREISGTGPIRFLLKDNSDGFRIINSEYEFNAE
jgi:curved DNA-binding protein CbpA